MVESSSTIDFFLTSAAAKQPTPGGGAVAALAGALAAAMGEMVLAYSVGKKNLIAFDAANTTALAELSRARELLTELIADDQRVFTAYNEAKKNGGDVLAATRECVRVPMTIGLASLAILRVANRVVRQSNPWLLSDLAVCGELATATVRSAIHNVRVNLPSLPDNERQFIMAQCDRLLADAITEIKLLIPAIASVQAS